MLKKIRQNVLDMEEKKKLTIAVTGMNAVDNPGPGVPVARSLREAFQFDVRIIGLCYGSLEPGAYMDDVVDSSYLLPYPSEGEEAMYNRLLYIQSQEHIDVLVPNLDAELFPFIQLSAQLRAIGIRMVLPTAAQFDLRQKDKLSLLAKCMKISVPRYLTCHSFQEYIDYTLNFPSGFQYPVVVKGRYYEAYVAYNYAQAESYFNQIAMKWGYPVIVQQFVPGSEFNIVGNGDGKGHLLAMVAMRKMYVTEKGKAWSGISVEDENLRSFASDFVQETLWRGPFELELMKGDDGIFYLIEVNPRFPAWVYLATAVGQNIPKQVVQMSMNEQIEPCNTYDVGKMFVRYSWDMIVDHDEYGSFAVRGEKQSERRDKNGSDRK